MSYLNASRLHFAGTFRANPCTVNNDTRHFNLATFKERYQAQQDEGDWKGWWNPLGTNSFRLSDCKVTRICYADGSSTSDPQHDAVAGMSVKDAADRPAAKIVDLDPEQQFVTEIYGLQLNVGTGNRLAISGEFVPASFADMWWMRRAPYYQSVLRPAHIDTAMGSRILQELLEQSEAGVLSIKFIVDLYDPPTTYGRIFGTIGPYVRGEPEHFVAARYLRPVSPDPNERSNLVYCISAVVDDARGKVRYDLGNALRVDGKGAPNDIGTLQAAYRNGSGGIAVLGEIPYREPHWYNNTAGICELPADRALVADELADLAETPLLILRSVPGSSRTMAASENPMGLYARADKFTFRMNPGEQQEVVVHVTQFGRPPADMELMAQRTTEHFGMGSIGDQDEPDLPPQPKSGTPESALVFSANARTDRDGVARFKVIASDPGTNARFFDGQIYGVAFYPASVLSVNGDVDAEYRHNFHHALSILVWQATPDIAEPTWDEHVRPIMQQYFNLYPVMKGIADLQVYEKVVERRKLIEHTLRLPVTHPSYMPITRDLSDGKKDLILRWLRSKGEDGLPLRGEPLPHELMAEVPQPVPRQARSVSSTYRREGFIKTAGIVPDFLEQPSGGDETTS